MNGFQKIISVGFDKQMLAYGDLAPELTNREFGSLINRQCRGFFLLKELSKLVLLSLLYLLARTCATLVEIMLKYPYIA